LRNYPQDLSMSELGVSGPGSRPVSGAV